MEARAQSEAHQDLDSKLAPIRYEDIRHTQGENHTRQQISSPYKQHSNQHQRPSFSAIQLEPDPTYSNNVSPIDQADTNADEEDPDNEYFEDYEDPSQYSFFPFFNFLKFFFFSQTRSEERRVG